MSEYKGSRSEAVEALFAEQPKALVLGVQKKPLPGTLSRKTDPRQVALLKRLMREHPIDSLLMGASGRGDFVEQAIEGAASQGFTRPADVRLYLDLMVLFGHRFDVDPQLPWVETALKRKSMKALFGSALDYLGAISGETGNLYVKALLRARKCLPSSLVDKQCGSAADLAALLAPLHPEKNQVMRAQLPALFELARTLTSQHSKGVRALYPVMMFLLGSHFETDPRYAWAGELLRDSGSTEAVRYKRLHEEALSRLRFALRSRSGLDALVEEVG
jgi:hypothetical protein